MRICAAAACVIATSAAGALGDAGPSASPVKRWEVTPTSLVARGEPPLQKIDVTVECEEALPACRLRVWSGERLLAEKTLAALAKGKNRWPNGSCPQACA